MRREGLEKELVYRADRAKIIALLLKEEGGAEKAGMSHKSWDGSAKERPRLICLSANHSA
ncbi:hypothetical protein K443DRAFT_678113 [Laccaria amethystina LaAM-08-1]|uniref:Uncharacterized protein n=1 Tax=Laccaria amethystina LaAM-08-1 TaxID=1095629 RepID=A0A0C9XA48_9AGAR|nr:hypothetical protein K443DRAFT_678113 [Laccaria amethystina LaAM-08-1]